MNLRRILSAAVVMLAAAGIAFWLQSASRTADPGVTTGGRLVVAYRAEPRTFNRYVSATVHGQLIAQLTQATLVRVNRATGALEPRLATDWQPSPDGLSWTMKLRPGLKFSDGVPFTSADVVFSFEALYHPTVKSPLAGGMTIKGAPLIVHALDDLTVVLTLPSAYAPGLTLLDALPILPRHKLEPALRAGTFASTWTTATDPREMTGLGPFVLESYVPGERLVFTRNPHFWRQDAGGRRLPYLDAVELQIVPDHNAEMLRLQSGEVDLGTDRLRAEDVAAFETLRAGGQIAVIRAGVSISPEMFWFNLDPGAARAKTRPWLQRDELRLAISHAVDRQAIVDTIFLGAAEPIFGPITPGHGEWHLPDLPPTAHDLDRARTLLAEIGMRDRDGDGTLEDASGQPARFAVTTQKGNTVRERLAAVVQQQVRRVGLVMDVVPVERNALLAQWSTGDYDAILFAAEYDAFDPARNLAFWQSSGGFHVWHPNQKTPATPWEARIDALMAEQAASPDPAARVRLFADVQREFRAHMPVLYFAAPRVYIATSARLQGVIPSVLAPPVLWNAESLSLAAPADAAARK